MNESQLSRFSGAYLAALRTHCTDGGPAGIPNAHEIGREAVAIGMETLELAGIHDKALNQLLGLGETSASQKDLITRAAAFFTEAMTPIEETHEPALQVAGELTLLQSALDERTRDLAAASEELQRRVAERAAAETKLQNSQQSSDQLLKDSLVLEKQLRDMTRQILSATEGERQEMSRQCYDDIAQTLLGIHLRFLALTNEVDANHSELSKEISTTQRLVSQAAKTISNLAHGPSN